MAVEFADGVVIGADSRTTTGYICVICVISFLIALNVCIRILDISSKTKISFNILVNLLYILINYFKWNNYLGINYFLHP